MKRYWMLLVCVLIDILLGFQYTWSMFGTILQEKYGFSGREANWPFSVAVVSFALGFVFSGRVQDRMGPRFTCIVGGLVYGAGLTLAGIGGPHFPTVLLGCGVMMGIGIAFGYIGPLATAVKWFPDSKGVAAGVVVGSFASGSFVLGAVGKLLIAHGMTMFAVLTTFGLVTGSAIVLLAFVLQTPETTPDEARALRAGMPKGLLASGHFWALVLAFFSGTFGGLAVTGNVEKIGKSLGATAWWAGVGFLLWSVGNTAGRVAWGALFERIGVRATVMGSLALQCVTISLMLAFGHAGPAFAILAFSSGFNYGGNFVLYAAEVAHAYGAHRVGTVYSIIYVVYCVSGFSSPYMMGRAYDSAHNYAAGLVAAAVLPAVGAAAFILFYRRPWEGGAGP